MVSSKVIRKWSETGALASLLKIYDVILFFLKKSKFKVTHSNQTKIEASRLWNMYSLKAVGTIFWLTLRILLKYWLTSWRNYLKIVSKRPILEEHLSPVIRRSLWNVTGNLWNVTENCLFWRDFLEILEVLSPAVSSLIQNSVRKL